MPAVIELAVNVTDPPFVSKVGQVIGVGVGEIGSEVGVGVRGGRSGTRSRPNNAKSVSKGGS